MEVPEHDDALLDQARTEAWRQIQHDLERVSSDVKPLLAHLADGLLDGGREALFPTGFDFMEPAKTGRATAEAPEKLSSELGLDLPRYVTRCKMEVAKTLLRYLDLKVWKIAYFTGYSGVQPFWRAFKASTGLSPGEYRKRAEPRVRKMVPATELNSDEFWFRATVNALDEREHAELLDRFRARCLPEADGSDETWPVVTFALRGTPIENDVVQGLWEKLRALPLAEQRQWLRHLRVDSPAFFQLLLRQCDDLGRNQPQRGLEVAELALEHLDWNAALLADELPNLRALGLAWLAASYRRVDDFPAATRHFARAWESWRVGRDQRVEAEICCLEGTFLLFERRYEEALGLLARSIGLAQATGYSRILVAALLQRVSIVGYTASAKLTIPDIQLALRHLERLDEPYLKLTACSHLATSYALAGRHEHALSALADARELCRALDEPVVAYQLDWVEGIARKGLGDATSAERLFQEARAGCIDLDSPELAGLTSLELAILNCEQGRQSEALRLASEAIPVFEALRIYDEHSATVELIRDAIAANDVTLEVLDRARGLLELALRDPTEPLFLVGKQRAEPGPGPPGRQSGD